MKPMPNAADDEGKRAAASGDGATIGIIAAAALSLVRLPLAGAFVLLDAPLWRLAVVVAAAGSDAIDGIAARRWGRPTWWGGMLDAGTDKLFALVVLIDLMLRDQLAGWQLVLLLARDIVVVVGVLVLLAAGRFASLRHVTAAMPGKVATGLVFALVIVLVALPEEEAIHAAFFLLAAAASLGSALFYVAAFLRRRRDPAE